MNRLLGFILSVLFLSCGVSVLVCTSGCQTAGVSLVTGGNPGWMELSRVGSVRTYGETAFWGGKPELTPRTRVKILEAYGPGVITSFHVSGMIIKDMTKFSEQPVAQLIIRVFYDGQTSPAIEMPLMDFVGDIDCRSQYFSSVFMSKVKESHNFRIPMPFREHITIEVENPSDRKITGYIELTYDRVKKIPAECGYLFVDYRKGALSAQKTNTVFELEKPGVIVAHWLQYETELARDGQLLCEADQMLYLDGDTRPTVMSLGSEDLYGSSWGFIEKRGDGIYTSFLRNEELGTSGSRIAVLRCRSLDPISFEKSCSWVMSWSNTGYDVVARQKLGNTPIPYRHCVYYYSRD